MRGLYTLIIILGSAYLFDRIAGDFEFCNPGISANVFRFTVGNCPEGVLFELPVLAKCLESPDGPEHFIADICETGNFSDFENATVRKLHFWKGDVTDNVSSAVDDTASCLNTGYCEDVKYFEVMSQNITEPERDDLCDVDHPDANLTQEEQDRRQDARVFNQTERMFKFIVGLITESRPNGPGFRVVKLLRQSFRILETYSHVDFLPHKFTKDILTGFLFLLRDSDLSNFIDVDVQDYDFIRETLDQCERMSKDPFKLTGTTCKSCSSVHFIEKDGQSSRYVENEFSFEWGRYDIPVDATWSALSFVHGLCYGTFRLNMNYHHLFQRATELLFTPEIQYRWSRPPKLLFEDIWDNMLSAPVKSTMRNLDAYVSAAYYNTPFLHRIERPIRDMKMEEWTTVKPGPAGNKGRRRKRSAARPTMTLDTEEELEGAGWCFQTRDDAVATLNAYVNTHCPDAKLALETIISERYPINRMFIDLDGGNNNTDSSGSANDAEYPDTS